MPRSIAGAVAVCVVALSAVILTVSPARSDPAPASKALVNDAAIDDGRLAYIQNCATCHGIGGEGSDVAPALTASSVAALDFYLRTGRMPLADMGRQPTRQEPKLPPDEIEAIIAYASQFAGDPQIPTVVTTAGDLQLGWQLYINNCAACHGASGSGGAVGMGFIAPSLWPSDPVTVAEAMLIGPGVMPPFAFEQHEVDSIAAYVEYLDAQPAPGGIELGGTGPVAEGLVAALAGVAVLIVITRWVTREPSRDPSSE